MDRRSKAVFRRIEDGSMVVEAAMVLPAFLLFVLFLIFIIQMTLYSTALQATASDTVKMVASHMYPAALAAEKWKNDKTQAAEATGSTGSSETSATGKWTLPRLSVEEWAGTYAQKLPSPLDEWVGDLLAKGEAPLQKLQAGASEAALDLAVKPLLRPYLASEWLEYDRIHVSNVMVPDLKGGTRPYFGLVLSYRLPMKVPFLNKSLVLEASSAERIWIGATDESGGTGTGGSDSGQNIGITVLEKPNPGVANHQGKIRAKVKPGISANLAIFYKSGQSTAKYLGWKQADDQGYIEWEWKIGVNTTPGTWTFVITLDDGTTLKAEFEVVKKK
ncbi:TadE/TadG family type IV pilus assembly protein [Paenibacillus sp. NFR01]|uniref:TadE/TadG family type IV pilus assembly protein n=1 Tax=Paenibacillus sp. NFR01 TaxID=1566279 RepID=UPI0008C407BB|nr:TadE/TadG family type IV pilus assembly protein [Paenibacillus sp. NFR01]SET95314.1 TadE-like protein [Paenibacillus sp. NFR01]